MTIQIALFPWCIKPLKLLRYCSSEVEWSQVWWEILINSNFFRSQPWNNHVHNTYFILWKVLDKKVCKDLIFFIWRKNRLVISSFRSSGLLLTTNLFKTSAWAFPSTPGYGVSGVGIRSKSKTPWNQQEDLSCTTGKARSKMGFSPFGSEDLSPSWCFCIYYN